MQTFTWIIVILFLIVSGLLIYKFFKKNKPTNRSGKNINYSTATAAEIIDDLLANDIPSDMNLWLTNIPQTTWSSLAAECSRRRSVIENLITTKEAERTKLLQDIKEAEETFRSLNTQKTKTYELFLNSFNKNIFQKLVENKFLDLSDENYSCIIPLIADILPSLIGTSPNSTGPNCNNVTFKNGQFEVFIRDMKIAVEAYYNFLTESLTDNILKCLQTLYENNQRLQTLESEILTAQDDLAKIREDTTAIRETFTESESNIQVINGFVDNINGLGDNNTINLAEGRNYYY